MDTINKLLYISFKDPLLSSIIPLNHYKEILNIKHDLLGLRIKDIEKVFLEFDDNLKSKGIDNERYMYEDMIKNNFKYSLNNLVENIKKKFDNEIESLNRMKVSINLNLDSYNDEYNKLNSDIPTGLSSNNKKRYKKLLTIVKDKVNKNKSYVPTLMRNISKLSLQIEKIDKDILYKKEKKREFIDNYKNLSFTELNNLQSIISSKNTKPKKVITLGSIRSYSTLNRLVKNMNCKNIKISRFYSTNNYTQNLSYYINSPIYIELQRIINNSNLDYNTQIQIEQFLLNQGALLMKDRLKIDSEINYYKFHPTILEYLKKCNIDLEKLINNYKDNIMNIKNKDNLQYVESLIILSLNNDEIISRLLGKFLLILSNNNLNNKNTNCTELSCDLAQSLLYLYYKKEFNKEVELRNKSIGLSNFVDTYLKDLKDIATDPVLIQIGFKLFSLLEEVKLINTDLITLERNHKQHIYVVNKNLSYNIGKIVNLYSISYKIPMIVKPKKYDRINEKEILGGYLLNDEEYFLPLIIKNSELRDQSVIKDENIIYSMVNKLSSVDYKINSDVLEFILEYGIELDLLTDPNLIHDLEIKKNKGKRLTLLEKKTLDSFISKKYIENNILGLALILKNVPQIYIPVRIDNRGRFYCAVDYLHYQGNELAKSLLMFSKGEKVYKSDKESIDYLKIFGANCFGNGIDKKSYNDRIK